MADPTINFDVSDHKGIIDKIAAQGQEIAAHQATIKEKETEAAALKDQLAEKDKALAASDKAHEEALAAKDKEIETLKADMQTKDDQILAEQEKALGASRKADLEKAGEAVKDDQVAELGKLSEAEFKNRLLVAENKKLASELTAARKNPGYVAPMAPQADLMNTGDTNDADATAAKDPSPGNWQHMGR